MTIARKTQIIASSPKGIEAAIEEGMKRVTKTLRGVTGFQVEKINAQVKDGKISEYRVHMEVTFILEK